MGALWCMEKDIREVTRKASSWSHVRFLNTLTRLLGSVKCQHHYLISLHSIENDATLATAH